MSTVSYKRKKTLGKKTSQYHIYYQRVGVYDFLLKNLKKLFLGLVVLVGLILGFQLLFPNFNDLMIETLNGWPDLPVLSVFFLSESFLGLIPPDLFIIWSQKFNQPYLMVLALSAMSYLGGVLSYFIGKYLGHLKLLEKALAPIVKKQKELINKFGGILIVIAALFPLPFSAVCIVAGAVEYHFSSFLRLALFRFLRFFGYAIVLFQIF